MSDSFVLSGWDRTNIAIVKDVTVLFVFLRWYVICHDNQCNSLAITHAYMHFKTHSTIHEPEKVLKVKVVGHYTNKCVWYL